MMPEVQSYVPIGCYSRRSANVFVPHKVLQGMLPTLEIRPRWRPALKQLGVAVFASSLSLLLLLLSPWYLLPVAWAITGLTLSHIFMIGHDCAHGSWTPSTAFNNFVGELTMDGLLEPFHAYKLRHLSRRSYARKPSAPVDDEPACLTPLPVMPSPRGPAGLDQTPDWLLDINDWFTNSFFPKDVPHDQHHAVSSSIRLTVSMWLVLMSSLFALGGLKSIVRFWGMPMLSFWALRRPFFKLLTDNVNALLPEDIMDCLPSYDVVRLSNVLHDHFKQARIAELARYYLKRINWLHVFILFGTPLYGIIGALYVPLTFKTFVWAFLYYAFSGLGITAGYHRYYAHRAYDATKFVQWALLIAGTAALQGSVKWWSGGHRVHHRYTDTPQDPYNSKGGLAYAHFGWMMVHPKPENKVKADIRDLNADPLVRWQHKHYLYFGPFVAYLLPALVSWIGWNDFLGGLVYAGFIRLFLVHHATFCVNSIAHYLGEATYDDERTPRDSIITAFLTFGEGFHNFHHEFPFDYRNGLKWYDYDPTKVLIWLLSKFGLTFNLRQFDENAIKLGMATMAEKKLKMLQASVSMPPTVDQLPVMTAAEFTERITNGEQLLRVNGLVHDVGAFIPQHPGGPGFLRAAIGKDGTDMFEGRTGVYRHSNAARNILASFRIARYVDDKLTASDSLSPKSSSL